MSIEPLYAVPHLTTALDGPLHQLESLLLTYQGKIEAWLRSEWLEHPAPFYTSVDLRNAGFKLAPVDTNLFPAGFNNLNRAFLPLCIQAIQTALERTCPKAANILLIPENHSRNQFYFESLATLIDIITKAGFSAHIGSLEPGLEQPRTISVSGGRHLCIEPVSREGNRLVTPDFSPCMILLNNDLSAGTPDILKGLEQPVIPSPALGWATRSKTTHFGHYKQVAATFGALIGMDPWWIDPLFRNCGEINFMKHEGEYCLAHNTEILLTEIQKKYDEYGIRDKPFVIIKSDSGTYGMAVMTVHSPEDAINLNRKQRTKMSSNKDGRAVSQVILQEGVYTYETWGNPPAFAEPVVYLIDHFVVGGFYRVHTERGPNENLNAPGMKFEPLAFADCCNSPSQTMAPNADPNRFYAYGVIARLAQLAAAREATNLV